MPSSSTHQDGGLFAFVAELADDHDALVDRSREVLRNLSRSDDRVALYLPFSPPSSAVNVHSPLPEALRALNKTAVVVIHSPSARNALSAKMMAELADIVALLENPDVHGKLNAVVLRGTGGWFCAGADLKVAQQELTSPEAGAAMGALMIDTLTKFRRLPLVSVACIEGGAYGGGAELATACDFRILEAKAVIQFVQVRMGVSSAWGGDVAICSFLTPFDVITPAVSHGAKRVINRADDVSLDGVLSYEHDVFKSLWGGPANLEALEGALKKEKK
ncbi:hypothetical protein PI125_g478 [Phytophthora idaei]|nr:hypothetical protein PI125_g478 [Phytophthora idaei]